MIDTQSNDVLTQDRFGKALEHIRLTLGGGILGCCAFDLLDKSPASQAVGALLGMYLASVLLHLFPAEGGDKSQGE